MGSVPKGTQGPPGSHLKKVVLTKPFYAGTLISDFSLQNGENKLLLSVTAQSVKLFLCAIVASGLIQASPSCTLQRRAENTAQSSECPLSIIQKGKELGSQARRGFLILSGTQGWCPLAHECDSEVHSAFPHHLRLLNACHRFMDGQQPGLRAGTLLSSWSSLP